MSDSIDSQLLEYYQRELTWLRHAGGSFAAQYPRVAQRLELSAEDCTDPHVERLLEGFALLTARLQRRLDDDYAQFSDALLEQLYPLMTRPLPSCAIARFEPDPARGSLSEGYRVPRDTALFVNVVAPERLGLPRELHGHTLRWRTCDDLDLWPISLVDAQMLDEDAVPAITGDTRARAALRLTFTCQDAKGWRALGIRSLRVHLAGAPVTNGVLYDLLAAHCQGVRIGAAHSLPRELPGLPRAVGFADEQALLPDDDNVHPGLRLLLEYFAFAEKFAFFDLPLDTRDAEDGPLCLYLLFDRAPAQRVQVQASDLALGCVPVINLFSGISEPLRPDGRSSEYRLVADAHRDSSVEIHSVRALRAQRGDRVETLPAYHGWQHSSTEQGLYWHARRIEGVIPRRAGSDLLLSLVDTRFVPTREHPDYTLSAQLWCTNRCQAERLPAGTELDFERPGPVARVHLRKAPTPQVQPRLGGPSRWQLVAQLSLNHRSLVEGPDALNALRELLQLSNIAQRATAQRQVDGLLGLRCERVMAQVGEDAWRGWRKGLEVRLELDPQAFIGASAVLFSGVLAQFFSLYATANRFVRTVLVQGNQEIVRWTPQAGQPLNL